MVQSLNILLVTCTIDARSWQIHDPKKTWEFKKGILVGTFGLEPWPPCRNYTMEYLVLGLFAIL